MNFRPCANHSDRNKYNGRYDSWLENNKRVNAWVCRWCYTVIRSTRRAVRPLPQRIGKMNASQFATKFDTMPVNIARRQEAHDKGLRTGQDATEFHIAVNGGWSTTNKDGSSTFAYERLGYHANTAYFFQGVLESGVEIVDHRQVGVKNRFDSIKE